MSEVLSAVDVPAPPPRRDASARKRSPLEVRMRVLRKRLRVEAYALHDSILRPRARTAEDTPWAPEAITVEWLNDTVARRFPGGEVTAIDLGAGSSGTSVRRQMTVCWREPAPEDAPTSLFLKTCPTALTRMANSAGGVAIAEGNFYRLLRPQLEVEAPLGYHSKFDRKSCRSVQLLEDLVQTKDARFCNWRSAIDRTRAEQIVGLLAEYHGRFHDDPQLESMSGWLRTFPQWLRSGFVNSGFDVQHRKAFQVGEDLIPPRLRDGGQRTWDAVIASLATHDARPRTLIHSDVHLGNWYVTSDGRMGLCDWQCISRGHGSRDLAYAIATTLTVEDRRAWERELVTLYVERLSSKVGRTFDFDETFALYREQLPAALLMWTTTLCPAPSMPDMQPLEMSREMMKRLTHAIDDNDAA